MSCPGTTHDLTAFKSRREAAVTGVVSSSSESAKACRSLSSFFLFFLFFFFLFLGLGVVELLVKVEELKFTGKTFVFDLLLSDMTEVRAAQSVLVKERSVLPREVRGGRGGTGKPRGKQQATRTSNSNNKQ